MITRKPRLVEATRKFWDYEKKEYNARLETKKGLFHGFCQEGEDRELECRAIVEFENGTVDTVRLQDFRFLEPW